jgi:tRNA1(Val) A37 N6-methylase TrmN6
MDESATTIDGLLNRRMTIEQPAKGYRVAVDTVFLAAAVPALPGDRVLDMGCGVGGALLCVACRVPGIAGIGIDIQGELIEMFRRNIARNPFALGLEAIPGDVAALPPDFAGMFDHVLMNPPFHDKARHDASANIIKQTANSEKTGDLKLWIAGAAAALKSAGTLTIIHRADRQDEIIGYLQPVFGEIEILSLLRKEGATAKRIIMRARKGAIWSLHRSQPLILHKSDGGYTDAAEAILRHCQKLVFQSP